MPEEVPEPNLDNENPCIIALDNKLFYLPGGSLYLSDDGASSWQRLSPPSILREGQACVAVGKDAILVTGGNANDELYHSSTGIYNITTDTWTTEAPLNLERTLFSAADLPNSNNVLVCGGQVVTKGSGVVVEKSCEIYDWNEKTWTMADFSMDKARYNFGMFITQAVQGDLQAMIGFLTTKVDCAAKKCGGIGDVTSLMSD